MRSNMKYISFRMLICALVSVLMLVSCSSAPAGYKKYDNRDAEFYIVYPDEWEIRSYEGSVVNFFSPVEDAEDKFFENVGVVTIPLIGYDLNDDGLYDEISLEQYISFSQAEIGMYIEDYAELEVKDIEIGGIKAKRLVYTGKEKVSEDDEEEADPSEENGEEPASDTEESITYKWIQVIAIHDEVAYIITLTSLIDSNEMYMAMFDKMIEHCRIGA